MTELNGLHLQNVRGGGRCKSPLLSCDKTPQECVNRPMKKEKMNNCDFSSKDSANIHQSVGVVWRWRRVGRLNPI